MNSGSGLYVTLCKLVQKKFTQRAQRIIRFDIGYDEIHAKDAKPLNFKMHKFIPFAV